MKVYEPEHYDIRPLLHCFMLAVTSNCAVVFQLKNFEDDLFQSLRNFSFPMAKRFFYIVMMYILLLLPEFIFIWKAYPVFFSAEDFFQLFLFGISLLCLFHASLYTNDMNIDSFMKIVFLILSILFFVIFYDPGILLPFAMLLLSFALYNSYYLDFEKKI